MENNVAFWNGAAWLCFSKLPELSQKSLWKQLSKTPRKFPIMDDCRDKLIRQHFCKVALQSSFQAATTPQKLRRWPKLKVWRRYLKCLFTNPASFGRVQCSCFSGYSHCQWQDLPFARLSLSNPALLFFGKIIRVVFDWPKAT